MAEVPGRSWQSMMANPFSLPRLLRHAGTWSTEMARLPAVAYGCRDGAGSHQTPKPDFMWR